MTTYVVLVVDDDEDRWETLSEAERQETYDADGRFGALLAERGGRIVGGQELTHSRETRVVARDGVATDGPYAETTEQIAGFYVVESDSLDDLTEALAPMLGKHHHVEIRPTGGAS